MTDSLTRRGALGAALALPIAGLAAGLQAEPAQAAGGYLLEVNDVENDAAVAAYVRGPDTATRAAVLEAAALSSSSMAVPRDPTLTVHTNLIRNQIALAWTMGIGRVVLPPLDPNNHSLAWRLDGTVSIPSGMEFDSRTAVVETTTFDAAFKIETGSSGVTIRAGVVRYGLARPTFAAVDSAGMTSEFVGVQCKGSRCVIEGQFARFRAGVRLSTASTAVAQEDNIVRASVAECDFGVVFYGQKNLSFDMSGSYSPAVGTPDAPHLVYGTSFPAVPSTIRRGRADAVDSTGGEVVKLRDESAVVIDSITGRNVPGMLWITNARGEHQIGNVIGIALTLSGLTGLCEPIRAENESVPLHTPAPTNVRKHIETLSLAISDGVAATTMRALSDLTGGFDIESAEVVYDTDAVGGSQELFRFDSDSSRMGKLKITNLGEGGVVGVRYLKGSRHIIDIPPVIRGVPTGIYIHNDVTGAQITLDRSRVITASKAIDYVPRPGIVVSGQMPIATGRWHSVRPAIATSTYTVMPNRQYWYPAFELSTPARLDALAMKVTTGVSGATIDIGICADSGEGYPRAVIAAASGLRCDTPATVAQDLDAPVMLEPGRYWVTFLVKGSSSPTFRGIANAGANSGAATADAAIEGSLLRSANDVSSLQNASGTVSAGTSTGQNGVPVIAFHIP